LSLLTRRRIHAATNRCILSARHRYTDKLLYSLRPVAAKERLPRHELVWTVKHVLTVNDRSCWQWSVVATSWQSKVVHSYAVQCFKHQHSHATLISTIQKLFTFRRWISPLRDFDQIFAVSFPKQTLELVGFPTQCLCLRANTNVTAHQHL